MKYNYVCLVCVVFIICYPSGFLSAQELKPPVWSVGDWWIVKSQVYDSGKIVAGAKPGWLPTQTWRFYVEEQNSIDQQPYFVVAIRPVEDNPCPYWFRYWFRVSDRYVGRYELYHPDTFSKTTTRNMSPSVVRKNFAPDAAVPFLTSKFPALPVTVPLFAIDREKTSAVARGNTIRSDTSAYTSIEFETIQEIKEIDAKTVSEKTNPIFLGNIGNISTDGNTLITIRTKSSLKEEQYWNPQLPWCIYGERVENSIASRRYWLVEVGND